MDLPAALRQGDLGARARVAARAVASVGAALVELREWAGEGEGGESQPTAAVDLAAEAWVASYLSAYFPGDALVCEERSKAGDPAPDAPLPESFWTVDALDGSRSYAEGFPGFCAQVAFVSDGAPRLGAIAEPSRGELFVAVEGRGAFRLAADGEAFRLGHRDAEAWPAQPRFIDSRPLAGVPDRVRARCGGQFLEHGSLGGKLCRLATRDADVLIKDFGYRLWDVAPGEALLREVGIGIRDWRGRPPRYTRLCDAPSNILVAPASWQPRLLAELDECAA